MFGGWVDIWSESCTTVADTGDAAPGVDNVLLENGDDLLLESGEYDALLLET